MELNEKIAKWLGNCPIGGSTPNFTESMDAILKWAVPKLKSEGINSHIHIAVNRISKVVLSSVSSTYLSAHTNVTMAFCQALEKYIIALKKKD